MKSIGTNEKALVLFQMQSIGTKKKHWLHRGMHRNKPKSIGFTEKAYEPTKKQWLIVKKHMNKQKSIGVNVKSIGTNEKALA